MTDDEQFYIVIPRWDEFQHYKGREPKWIKVYTRLLHDDAYLELSGTQRAVLHGLWILYAESGRKLPVNTSKLSRKLSLRVTKRTLESLNHAGFIEFRASTLLAQTREEENIKTFTGISNPRQVLHLLKTGSVEGT